LIVLIGEDNKFAGKKAQELIKRYGEHGEKKFF